ncbi:MAG TPA: glutathione S-transferase, partial [Rubrivivax sp.]
MITVHHLENSRSQRVLWLLEELGQRYEIKHYARDRKTSLAPPELAAVHPLGKSPVISDGTTVIAETGAIVEYLLERASDERLRPAAGTPERLRFTYWLHFAEGSAMPPLVMALV